MAYFRILLLKRKLLIEFMDSVKGIKSLASLGSIFSSSSGTEFDIDIANDELNVRKNLTRFRTVFQTNISIFHFLNSK